MSLNKDASNNANERSIFGKLHISNEEMKREGRIEREKEGRGKEESGT